MPPTLEDLIDRHQAELLAYMRRLVRDPQDAEDLLQEAWLRAGPALPRLDPRANHRAWLYRIAGNLAFSFLRRQKRAQARHAEVDLETLPAAEQASFDGPRMRDLVEALPARQQAALVQRLFQGMTYAEIAASLGGAEAAARANVYQALKKLRAQLGEDR